LFLSELLLFCCAIAAVIKREGNTMSTNAYTDFANEISPNPAKSSTPPLVAPIPGREAEMKRNNSGAFTFTLDHFGVLDRFLMIGSESAGYYVGSKETTKMSFDVTKRCIKEDGVRVVNRIVEYSLAGRAPKNDPAVVALSLAAVYGDPVTVAAAYDALPKVCRTGTHLFLFVSMLDALGKWNAAAKRGVAAWYTGKTMDKLAVQLLKYQQRNGWAHRDVLRLAHVKPSSDVQSNLFRYSVKGELEEGAAVPQVLIDFEYLKRATDKKDVIRLIEGSDLLTWEMVPTQFLKDKDVLMALVHNMGMTALIRKLGALTSHGVFGPLSEGSKIAIAKLTDMEAIRRGRVHPVTILQAMKQYSRGAGDRGSMTWTPDQRIITALDDAFYASFGAVDKTDENYLIGVDISGSMQGATVNGSPNLYAAEVAAVMAMAVARNQPNHHIVGFNHKLVELKVSPSMRLDAAMAALQKIRWDYGSTDCAKTYEYALANRLDVDKFVIITDNETNTGTQSPVQALAKYRAAKKQTAKSIVIATSVSEFTIADPKDGGMLDIAGFDSAAPQIIANF
jgi:60 kDa SS-A/Ro ribonucleoprotein